MYTEPSGNDSWIVILAGPSGSGKSTIGKMLSEKLSCSFIDADRYHKNSAKKQMSQKIPVDDTYRQAWIERLLGALVTKNEDGENVVLACSCLKRFIRKRFLSELSEYASSQIMIVWLDVSANALANRLNKRQGHFFPKELLPSQLDAMEVPTENELGLLRINCLGKTSDMIADEIIMRLPLSSDISGVEAFGDSLFMLE